MSSASKIAIPDDVLENVATRRATWPGISREDALALIEQEDLAALLRAAQNVRERIHGRTVSFSRKVFLPLTTLCRDFCGYCTFRKDPGDPGAHFMTPDEVFAVAGAGRRAGCKEALFSLGDQPERIFPEAREFLRGQGFSRTLDYLAAMCRLVLERTGLLPHSNPGLMSREDLAALRESNVSLGLMLENSSKRLLSKGEAHYRAPDKIPALRLQCIDDAGALKIPFTSGILIGIGETRDERVDSLFALRAAHEKHGHLQEVIVQNFRAKPGTPMAGCAEPSMEEMLRTLAVARLILPGDVNLQAPPNLSYSDFPRLLDGGINDWGGISPVTRDFINPEAAWPQIATLQEKCAEAGFELRERLAVYPEFVDKREFISEPLRARLAQMTDANGYARNGAHSGD